jgi:ubiquinone/menaquinone biosynthesis C-methylase UbiE
MAVPAISYGPEGPNEADVRLCGDVAGKRVVELGVGDGANVVALARAGARTIGLDPSAERLASARRAAERADVRVELRDGDLADLGFATSASVDLVVCIDVLNEIEDASRVFRQVHRILKPHCVFVLSLAHPFGATMDAASDQPLLVRRSYWSRGTTTAAGGQIRNYTVSSVFTALTRSDFDVDALLEPEPPATPRRLVPPRLVLRARKLGV